MQRSQRLGGSQCSAEGRDPTVPATFTEVPNMPKSKPKRSMRLELRRNVKPGTTVARRRVFCHKSSMPETKTRTSTTSPRRRPWSSPFALRLFAQGVRSRSHCDCKRGPPKKLRGGLGSHDEGFGCVLLRFSLHDCRRVELGGFRFNSLGSFGAAVVRFEHGSVECFSR